MKAPVKIWKHEWSWKDAWSWKDVESDLCVSYIRADLVDKLKWYAMHDYDCGVNQLEYKPCTCGLTETLRKLGE